MKPFKAGANGQQLAGSSQGNSTMQISGSGSSTAKSATSDGRPSTSGLYAITPPHYPDAERLLAECEAALVGGASLLQFRDKSGDAVWRFEVAQRLNGLCRRHGIALIVNDDIELALRVGAGGVHLGSEDAPLAEARASLPPGSHIGWSCYNRLDLAELGTREGATHLAFGSMYPSPTKPGAVRCPAATLTAAKAFGLPLVAIGGITLENGAPLIAAGANYLAVISAVFDAPDVRRAAEAFRKLWANSP